MGKLTLGLDLGPNSIGWALVRENTDDTEASQIVDMGVRVFPEGVDAFETSKERSRNESRRVARAMRRQIRRRRRRQERLATALIEIGLWPADADTQADHLALDPYLLRARAPEEKLEPFEIGRVLLHLNQRRGFLSNRKKDRGDAEVKGMLAEINENEKARVEEGHPTIGALLAARHLAFDHRKGDSERVRQRHLSRSQLDQEFHVIWEAQREHYPALLTDRLKHGAIGGSIQPRKSVPRHDARRRGLSDLDAFGLHGLIFFQRKMYWPKSVVGLCELEPKQKRCPRADRRAERFRVLQEVNNLRYSDTESAIEAPLTADQRTLLLNYLATKEKLTFDQIRKKLGFLDSVKFNLERGERSTLKGFGLDITMAKAIGNQWHDRPEKEKTQFLELLANHERDDDELQTRLVKQFGCTPGQAEAALDVDLPPGYISISLKALDRLLPHLERGLVYQSASDPAKSALHAAGYFRRDELQRRLFDKLPNFERVNPGEVKLGAIPNPVVRRALVELRKVVNAIIREYGRPDAIHIEMAREVQMGAKKRKEVSARMRKREAERSRAADEVRAAGNAVRRESILRYLLWEEQVHECLYCGEPISQQQLFGGECDIDHILPYSRCLDDSQLNKVICHRACNDAKGNRTPREWLEAAEPARYAQLCQHAGSLLKKGRFPYAKYRRFLQQELELDKFIARQLTDTGYITRATVEYVQLLFDRPHAVLGLKGQLTAELRWHWGLDTILAEMPDSPAWREKNNLRPGEKNRADHRHHAIDALVVALTTRPRLHKLSDVVRRGGARVHGEILSEPWDGFRDDVAERVQQINVSHRVERGVRGALHKETLYGATTSPDEWVNRKPVTELSSAEIDRIRDDGIRRIVLERLAQHGIVAGRGKSADAKKLKAALADLAMPSGVPIKKVRLVKQEKSIQPLRGDAECDGAFVKPGNTHHLCIFEFEVNGNQKREAVFVTMLEAARRLRRQEPLVQRIHPQRPNAKFIMSLATREMVLAETKGQEKLFIYKTAKSTDGQIRFVEHSDARRSSQQPKFVATANTLDARKVTVDPLGRIRWAND